MSTKILFVDDEQHVLSSHRRTFRKKYDVVTAMGGEIALETIETKGPFPVVVSDMQMPGMNGVQLLSKIRKIAPDTIRIMLTGNADLNTAMEAVNEGNVYRFLTKPCHPEQLAKIIDSGVRQYQLIKAEQELLNKTLKGSIKVLIDILSIIDQQSFSRTLKLRDYIRKLCKARIISSSWELDISALLSQIGQVTIPSGVISKIHKNEEISDVEKNMLDRVPQVGHDLLANIPRLENISKIILYQNKLFNGQGLPNDSVKGIDIPLGSRIIKILSDFLQIEESG
ncbi:MAG: response regulator, partial [Calditrichales bacterium]|nr:response regulator [Calditrichales bacterium]